MRAEALFPTAAHDHPALQDLGPLAWVALAVAGLAAAWVIWKAVRFTFHPGEEEPDHIKRSILQEPEPPDPGLSSGGGDVEPPVSGRLDGGAP